jgi:hypothetical protein
MNAGTIASSTDLGVIPTSWAVQGTADYNGDGKSDVLWRNANGDVDVWLMNGATIGSAVNLGVIPSSWSVQLAPVILPQTGIFSDAPVGGLQYADSPSGVTGTTDGLGEFSYWPGDSVTFGAAGITLGTATGLSAASNGGSPQVITPLNLVPGATSATNSTVTAIGQFLASLNSVAVTVGEGNLATFVVPSPVGLSGSPATTVSTLLNTLKTSGVTTATLASAVEPGGVVQTAISSAGGTVPTAASAQGNVTQGVNAAGFIGSVWTASCAICNGGAGGTVTLAFDADGVVRGYGVIDSFSTGALIGTWSAGTLSAGLSFSAVTAPTGTATLDTSYIQGTLAATTGTAQIFSGGTAQGAALALTPVPIPAGASTAYLGGWKISVTPTDPGSVAGAGQSVFAIFEANGEFFISAAKGDGIGTWNPNTGIGSLTLNGDSPTNTCGVQSNSVNMATVNLAAGTFSLSLGGNGTITRAGLGSADILDNFNDNAGTLAEAMAELDIPLSLNVSVSWPANPAGGNASTSLTLGVALTGPGNVGTACPGVSSATKLEAYALRPEINSLGYGVAGTTSDTISFGYLKSQAANYSISVLGPQAKYCSVTQNGSGAIVDANSGNAAAYPTVRVVCTQ